MKDKLYAFFSYSQRSIRYLWRNGKGYLLLTVLHIFLSAISVFPGMYLMTFAVDLLTKRAAFREFLLAAGSILAVMLALSLVTTLLENLIAYVKSGFYAGIRRDIDEICLHTDYANLQSKQFLEKKKFALAAVGNGSLDLFIDCFRQILSCVIVSGGVFYILSDLTPILLIPLVLALSIELYNDYLNARQNFIDTKEEIEYFRKLGYLQSISTDFAYAKEIRMFNLKDRFRRRMDEVDRLLYAMREDKRRQRRPRAILLYGSDAILDTAIYLYLGYKVLSSAISLGRFTLYSGALRQIKNSVSDVIFLFTRFAVNTEYLRGFFDFMEQKEDPQDVPDGACDAEDGEILTKGRPVEIRFDHVSFRYPASDQFTLKDIDFTVRAGERLLIVGENGAGKTTFVKLLCGLYKPTEGRILFCGRDISTIPRETYFRCLSTVFQDYKLFAMPICENICAMHREDGSRLDDALEKAGLRDKVARTAKGTKRSFTASLTKRAWNFRGAKCSALPSPEPSTKMRRCSS